jgi:hypothetical protein
MDTIESRQWQYVLQNLGEWEGSFTRLSSWGEFILDIPSRIVLQGLDENRTIHLVLRRFYPDPNDPSILQPQDLTMDFSAPSQGAVFFETGAFSEGSIYCGGGRVFGVESAFKDGDRRLRAIQQFDNNGTFYQVTLVREKAAGTAVSFPAELSVEDICGSWQGELVSLDPQATRESREKFERSLEVTPDDRLVWRENIRGTNTSWEFINSEENGGSRRVWQCSISDVEYRLLLLPGNAYSLCPLHSHNNRSIFLEVGWKISPHSWQILRRIYNDRGDWQETLFETIEN